MTAEEISLVAKDLSVSEDAVRSMQEKIANTHEVSADPLDHICSSQTVSSPEAVYIEEATQKHDAERLKKGMQLLDARAASIIKSRWLATNSKETLQMLAKRYGVSVQRINQIEKTAMNKLKLSFFYSRIIAAQEHPRRPEAALASKLIESYAANVNCYLTIRNNKAMQLSTLFVRLSSFICLLTATAFSSASAAGLQ